MSISQAYFQSEIALNGLIHARYPNVKAELTLMSTATKNDITIKHDTTIEAAPGILRCGLSTNSRYQNDIALLVNRGRAGGLTTAQMGTAMDAVVAAMP